MKIFSFLLIFVALSFLSAWEITDDLTLQIQNGKILGRFITSETGKPVKAFMGIPFARPPVGDLRFKAPVKAEAWTGTKLTQFDGPRCVQMSRSFAPGMPVGQEDCLYLNVYAPAETNGKKLPVVVWIHGGAFVVGEASRSFYGPDYIVDNDVILVAGNYRLGVLGFLSTEDKNAQGNFGLKDQQMVLQWVQENIEYFGGDRSSVTIWGESAGAVSVNYQMLSPTSRGLFHKAISNSGTIYNAWADPWRMGEAIEATNRLARAVNCTTTDSSVLISCLKSRTAEDLVLAGDADANNWSNRMTIEDFKDLSEPGFLTTRKLSDESVSIPWMLGMNSEEGLLLTAQFVQSEMLRDALVESWNASLPISLDYDHLNAATQGVINGKISQFYFGTDSLTRGFDVKRLTDLYTDVSFLGMVEALKHRFANRNVASTYVYLFTHKGSASYSATDNYEGTSHADDLIYLFPFHKNSFYSSMPTFDDETLIQYMPQIWTNFAKYGNPTPPSSSRAVSIPPWPVATSIPFDYMVIGNENGQFENLKYFSVKKGLYEERANFWINLKEDYKLSRWNGARALELSSILLFTVLTLSILK